MKVVVRVIMVSLLSHCEINFSCFIEALDSKGILRTLKKILRQPDNVLTLQVSLSRDEVYFTRSNGHYFS